MRDSDGLPVTDTWTEWLAVYLSNERYDKLNDGEVSLFDALSKPEWGYAFIVHRWRIDDFEGWKHRVMVVRPDEINHKLLPDRMETAKNEQPD
jgi:hypothetical protein